MVAVLEFKVEAPPQPQVQASTGPTKEKKEKKKKKDDTSNKPPAPSALPISGKPVTLSFNKGGPGSKPITSLSGPEAPAQTSLGFSAEDFAAEDDDAGATTSAEDNKATASKMVAPLIASKKTVSNIQKWNQVQEELSPNARVPKNFKDANLREIARQKAVAARQAGDSKVPEQPKYRDRASERRIMHNQPDVLSPNNVGRVDPIQTSIYAQGVGLGVSEGRKLGCSEGTPLSTHNQWKIWCIGTDLHPDELGWHNSIVHQKLQTFNMT
ncbi:hypothetical protein M405DRAFT_836447 [Rhizopogon salebrosus TDB-379]|nr:hypothetical protein M405DRAFT_836447 [Rhizopogon salebrosus TDB-379]